MEAGWAKLGVRVVGCCRVSGVLCGLGVADAKIKGLLGDLQPYFNYPKCSSDTCACAGCRPICSEAFSTQDTARRTLAARSYEALCCQLSSKSATSRHDLLVRNAACPQVLNELSPQVHVCAGFCMMYVCIQTFAVPGTLSLSLLAGALYGNLHGLVLVSGESMVELHPLFD